RRHTRCYRDWSSDVCSSDLNPALVFPDEARIPGKFTELDRIVGELAGANGRKVIVWSYYVRTIEALTARYAAHGAASLYGETPPDRKSVVQGSGADTASRRA